MYAVIRAGGKQYRVAPGDVIRVETVAAPDQKVEFGEVLAVSANAGEIARPQGEALVTGKVLGAVRGEKILVFHYKRKKQYKKLQGHRQPFTAVRITEINFDGQKFSAPEAPKKKSAKPKAEAAPASETAPAKKAATKKAPAKKAARTAKPKAKKK
jgi:large subunit ribosomal protein L21